MTKTIQARTIRRGAWAAMGLLLSTDPARVAAAPVPAPQTNAAPWPLFQTVRRPPLPQVQNRSWVRNPIDDFIAAEHEARGLKPRPEAPSLVLLRRVYLDLIGLSPTPEEQQAFLADTSPDAYEKVVDRLLEDPRHGERWGRHWMDVWRYSDWAGWSGGNQIRDSQPHIWRWRDWIVQSLNANKGYDAMILEMLAADECEPEDAAALPATGFLVRNYKMLSREQWLEDTVKHTSQAFLGLTMGCAKCHDHMFDPVTQAEYYELRAIFEPHQVRTDRVPGQLDTAKDGLARVFDAPSNAPTYFYNRGDERQPDTNRVMGPNVPRALGGHLDVIAVNLPKTAAQPDRRDFVLWDLLASAQQDLEGARRTSDAQRNGKSPAPEALAEAELNLEVAEAEFLSLSATLQAEDIEESQGKDTEAWRKAAGQASQQQRRLALAKAKLASHSAQAAEAAARTKSDEAASALKAAEEESGKENAETAGASAQRIESRKKEAGKAAKALAEATEKTSKTKQALAEAEQKSAAEPGTDFKPRDIKSYPATSTGRRLAFARWLADEENPLTARVAMNHIWLRHFGRGIVPSPADFGRNGQAATHPALLDWLAAELMARQWRMKPMHRLVVTSAAYRMASTSVASNAAIDPDNFYLWRAPSRRMEAELVRDNLLHVSSGLDQTMGGPEIDHELGLKSSRRSLYLRIAAEKEVEFLKVFDGPAVTECYQRRPTVVPQQALAMANSPLTARQARRLAEQLAERAGADNAAFVRAAFDRVLARPATAEELRACQDFLARDKTDSPPGKARENLVHVLFNHNDFITIR